MSPEIYNLQGEPISLSDFRSVFKRLVRGGEPQSDREKIISDAIRVANNNVDRIGTPTEAIMTAWFAFMSSRKWISEHTTPEGAALLSKTDAMLTMVVVNLLWEAWSALDGVDKINGQGELNVTGEENEDSGGGKGAIPTVPSPEPGPPN